MGFFDDIKAKIFGAPKPAETPVRTAQAELSPKPVSASAAPSPAPAAAAPASPAPAAAPAKEAVAAAPVAASEVDVAAILDKAVASNGQKLDWRKSIVDLLKALDIDSSLTARKSLAQELGYTGDMSDSAKMNVWLHKQVIQKLKDNGGKVPADLI
jgi:hypothetical protein